MASFPELSIIIPTRNRKEIFSQTLAAAIEAKKGLNVEIIVVNDSTSEIYLEEKYANLVQLCEAGGNGVANARNIGAKAAKGKWLLFLDNDMLISNEVLEKCLAFGRKQENGFCINANWRYPKYLLRNLSSTKFGRYLVFYGFHEYEGKAWLNKKLNNDGFEKVSSITSQFLFVSSEEFFATGGYNTTFSFAGFEDHEFATRLLNSGVESYILCRPFVFHNESDYTSLKPFLMRKRRSALTRRQGVEIGMKELDLNYSTYRKFLYRVLSIFSFLFSTGVWLAPNTKVFDPICRWFVNRLLGISIFKGFYIDFKKQ